MAESIGSQQAEGNVLRLQKYERFSIPCDLSWITLQEAVLKLGPSDTYVVHITRAHMPYAQRLVHEEFTCRLPVVINIEIDQSCGPFEWFVTANGKAVGSEGA